MKNRAAVKAHDSDDEPDSEQSHSAEALAVARREEEAQILENTPVIPDSECSPVALAFQQMQEHEEMSSMADEK